MVKKILMFILNVIWGIILGSIANGLIVMLGKFAFPHPEGIDVSTIAGINSSIQNWEIQHFITPFLAHAVGTLVGSCVTVYCLKSHKLFGAMIVGTVFLLGGVLMVLQLNAPMWFNIVDLVFAYLPISYLGYYIIQNKKRA